MADYDYGDEDSYWEKQETRRQALIETLVASIAFTTAPDGLGDWCSSCGSRIGPEETTAREIHRRFHKSLWEVIYPKKF